MWTKALFCSYLLFVTAINVSANENEYQRDIRQLPLFFNQLPRGDQSSKGQPFQGFVPQFVSFGGVLPQSFRPAPQVDEQKEEIDEELNKNLIAPSPTSPPQQQVLHFRQSQSPPQQQLLQFPTSSLPPIQHQQPITSAQVLQPQQTLILKTRPSQQEFQSRRPQIMNNQLILQQLSEEELEEKEEPDRLTELLPQSKFSCSGKKTGYYADDGLNCEVFHYCQDNARHSWICPEGFSFHQVHLICMPPSSDNICQQSSQYHFVNDFLYRPVNVEEAQNRPNVTLRYADRYYPETYYESNTRDEDTGENVRHFQQRTAPARQHATHSRSRPNQSVQQSQSQQQQLHQPSPLPFEYIYRPPLPQLPQQFARQPATFNNQAFHSSEEVNVPLQSKRHIVAAGMTSQHPAPTQPSFHQFENE